jgi:hypothetical protein
LVLYTILTYKIENEEHFGVFVLFSNVILFIQKKLNFSITENESKKKENFLLELTNYITVNENELNFSMEYHKHYYFENYEIKKILNDDDLKINLLLKEKNNDLEINIELCNFINELPPKSIYSSLKDFFSKMVV